MPMPIPDLPEPLARRLDMILGARALLPGAVAGSVNRNVDGASGHASRQSGAALQRRTGMRPPARTALAA